MTSDRAIQRLNVKKGRFPCANVQPQPKVQSRNAGETPNRNEDSRLYCRSFRNKIKRNAETWQIHTFFRENNDRNELGIDIFYSLENNSNG